MRAARADFTRVRGTKRQERRHGTLWTEPVKIPGALQCSVIDPRDGSAVGYSCQIEPASCDLTSREFENTARLFADCLGEPGKQSTEGTRRTTTFSPDNIDVQLSLAGRDSCRFNVSVEAPSGRSSLGLGPAATFTSKPGAGK